MRLKNGKTPRQAAYFYVLSLIERNSELDPQEIDPNGLSDDQLEAVAFEVFKIHRSLVKQSRMKHWIHL